MEVVTFKTEEEFIAAINGDLEHNGEPLYFEYKQRELLSHDGEKNSVEVIAYFVRQTDNKKFCASFTEGGQGDIWVDEDDMTFTEIVPRAKKPSITWAQVMDKFIKETPKELRTDKDTILEWLNKNVATPKFKK